MKKVCITTILFGVTALCCDAQVDVLTANYANARTNANPQETLLSPATVSSDSFGKLATFSVDGQVFAQPLYVSGLMVSGKSRNLLFVSTMHNSVYAFDADGGSSQPLWRVNLGTPVPASLFHFRDISPEIGILSTGVIDRARSALYVVSDQLQNGSVVFTLHALDLADGHEILGGPMEVQMRGTGNGAASQDGAIVFDPAMHLQRPGLLLTNDAIYLAFGSHADQPPYHGWLTSYDAGNLRRQLGTFLVTRDGDGGSIWQAGRGLAADENGTVYCMSANGDYDGATNFGESFLRFTGRAPALSNWYTPAAWSTLSDGDYDLSSGVALLPGSHLLLGGDKAGNFYALDGDKMGGLESDGARTAQIMQATQYGGIFNFALWSRGDAAYLYIQEQGENLRAYRLAHGVFDAAPFSVSIMAADIPYEGLTVSSNGAQDDTGIVWETTGDHDSPDVPGSLHAFDAGDLTNELWSSEMNPGRDRPGAFAKFVSPTVANGKVYVPTFSNSVAVYGLLSNGMGDDSPTIAAVSNAASHAAGAVAPGEVITIFGSGLGPSDEAGMQLDDKGLLATGVEGTRVLFDGNAASLVAVSANRVTAVAPFGLAAGSVTNLQVEHNGVASDPFPIAVAASAPGLYSADETGAGQGAILDDDGTPNSEESPALAGSMIALYATGLGLTQPVLMDGAFASREELARAVLPVTAELDGTPAEVLYAGLAPGEIGGIYQLNLRVPSATSGGSVSVVIHAGESTTQTNITVAVGGLGAGRGPSPSANFPKKIKRRARPL